MCHSTLTVFGRLQVGFTTLFLFLFKLAVYRDILQGGVKKVPAKFSDTRSVVADGLCMGRPKLVGIHDLGG